MRRLICCSLLVTLFCACDSPAEVQNQTAAATLPLAANASAYLEHLGQLAAKAEAAGNPTIAGTGKDLLLVKELRSLAAGQFWGEAAQKASRAPKADRRDPLPAIVAYHRALQAAGIDWVFVPVPAKVAVDPSLVPGAPEVDGRIDVHCVEFYGELRQAGVPVLDVLPALRELVANGQRAHCRTDSHWTPAACEVVADLVASRLETQAWFADAAKSEYATESSTISMKGDMASMRTEPVAPESLTIQVVKGATTQEDSRVLLLGDSHCLVFHSGGDMHAEHAGFPDQLMRALRMPIDVVGVRGSGATPSRVDAYRGARFAGKKAVVWCLTAREFTEGQGWATVPVKR